ncbi:hypothetical protein CVT25_014765 [Psilocybe cyanescens]|uniref:Uncharacterized protein n=1 Tax=Psilocybe cyanescens TaxID=93625 RepID=A0A409X5B0_PSICY|nr:hypothetical protein CVT25_014765 [Psilocybe cyanescens]
MPTPGDPEHEFMFGAPPAHWSTSHNGTDQGNAAPPQTASRQPQQEQDHPHPSQTRGQQPPAVGIHVPKMVPQLPPGLKIQPSPVGGHLRPQGVGMNQLKGTIPPELRAQYDADENEGKNPVLMYCPHDSRDNDFVSACQQLKDFVKQLFPHNRRITVAPFLHLQPP